MKIGDQFCTLPQAKRLKELGVRQASQNYWRQGEITNVEAVNSWSDQETLGEMIKAYDKANKGKDWRAEFELYSAFSTAELGDMLPKTIKADIEYSLLSEKEISGWYVTYWNSTRDSLYKTTFGTEAGARAEMVIALLEYGRVKGEEINI